MLMAPGTSLGGARPKANFEDADGTLWIAKFPAKDDRYDVAAWEYVAHRLAQDAGITVPPARLEDLGGGYRSFCVQRFDRSGPQRAPRRMYASAMTLTGKQDGEPHRQTRACAGCRRPLHRYRRRAQRRIHHACFLPPDTHPGRCDFGRSAGGRQPVARHGAALRHRARGAATHGGGVCAVWMSSPQ